MTPIENSKHSLMLKDICLWTCKFMLLRDSVHHVINSASKKAVIKISTELTEFVFFLFCFNPSKTIIIEEEYHVFSSAPNLIPSVRLISKLWYKQGDSRPKFVRLMQNTKPDIIRKLRVFINEILKIKD